MNKNFEQSNISTNYRSTHPSHSLTQEKGDSFLVEGLPHTLSIQGVTNYLSLHGDVFSVIKISNNSILRDKNSFMVRFQPDSYSEDSLLSNTLLFAKNPVRITKTSLALAPDSDTNSFQESRNRVSGNKSTQIQQQYNYPYSSIRTCTPHHNNTPSNLEKLKLIVLNLPKNFNIHEISMFFEQFGPVCQVSLPQMEGKNTLKKKQVILIMENNQDCNYLLSLQTVKFKNRKIRIKGFTKPFTSSSNNQRHIRYHNKKISRKNSSKFSYFSYEKPTKMGAVSLSQQELRREKRKARNFGRKQIAQFRYQCNSRSMVGLEKKIIEQTEEENEESNSLVVAQKITTTLNIKYDGVYYTSTSTDNQAWGTNDDIPQSYSRFLGF